ncbi:MAG: Ig-like domain-containing protein, partial [Bacteroidota bacterium]
MYNRIKELQKGLLFSLMLCGLLSAKAQSTDFVIDFDAETFTDGVSLGSGSYASGNITITYNAGDWLEDTNEGEGVTNALKGQALGGAETVTVSTVDGAELDFQSFYFEAIVGEIAQIEGFADLSSTGVQNTGFPTVGSSATVLLDDAIFDDVDVIVITSNLNGFGDVFDSFVFQETVAPSVLSAATVDGNSDGIVDGLELEFSEAITDVDFTAAAIADWTLNDGSGAVSFTGFSTEATTLSGGLDTDTDDEFVTLTISTGVSGTDAMDYAYTNDGGDDITDLSANANVLADIVSATASDAAAPIVLGAATVDTNGDGTVDGMEVEFSEAITDTDYSAAAIADWTLNDGSGAVSFTGFSTETSVLSGGLDSDGDDEFVTLTISTGVSGTDAMDYAYTNDGGDNITDLSVSANTLANVSTTTATDAANIVVLQALTIDTNDDGDVDAMEIEFSEPVEDDGLAAHFSDWSLDGSLFTGFNTSVSDLISANVVDDQYVTLTIGLGITGTAAFDYAYTNGNPGVDDITDFDNEEVLANISATTADDGAAPIAIAFSPLNGASNAAVNANIVITFSEAITDEGPGNITLQDFTNNVDDRLQAALTLDIGVANNDELLINPNSDLLNLNEYSVEIPPIRISDGTNAFAGFNGTSDYNFTTVASIPTYEVTWLDENPANGIVDRVQIDFNENVNITDGSTGTAEFDAFVISAGSFTTAVNDYGDGSFDDIGTITLDITGLALGTGPTDFPTIDYDQSATISVVANSDGTTEIANNDLPTNVTDGVSPVFVEASFYDFNSDGDIDEILVEMSEPVDEASIEEEDFLIDGSAATFTLSSGGSANVDNSDDVSTTDEFFTLEVTLANTDELPFEYDQDNANAELSDLSGNEARNDNAITSLDLAPPVLTAAAIFDTDGDGLIDEVEYTFSEVVSDADDNDTYTLADAGDITLPDGESATGFTAGDIALSDDGVNGFVTISNITGQLVINTTIGSFEVNNVDGRWDDDQGQTSTGDNAEDKIDGAGPVIVAAETNDAGINGKIDQVFITFSEGIADLSIDPTDFALTGSYTVASTSPIVSSPNLTVFVNEIAGAGNFDTEVTFDITVDPGILEDLTDGADFPGQTFSVADGTPPYAEVDVLSTSNVNPELTGIIDDENASLLVSVGSNTVSATNNADGTWTLAAGSLANDLTPQTYDVVVTTIDPLSNFGTDATTNELTVTGGIEITQGSIADICVGDFQQFSSPIIIAEAAATPGGFSSSGNLVLSLPVGFEFDVTQTLDFSGSTFSGDLSIDQETAIDPEQTSFAGSGSISIEIDVTGTTGQDEIQISNLWVRAVGPPVSGQPLVRTGGDLSIATVTDTYATLTSLTAPDPIASLTEAADPGTPLTEYVTKFAPRIQVNYVVPIGIFDNAGENVTFTGGASGQLIPGTNIIGVSMEVYLLSGTVSAGETVTGDASGAMATVNGNVTGLGEELLDFTLVADPSPSPTTRWYNASAALISPAANSKTNTELSATTPGLYTYEVFAFDGTTCESTPLTFDVLVYNDVHPNQDERTFADRSYVISDDTDTVFLSNPAGHTVSVTGNGISVVGGSTDPILAIFNPEIAGDDGAGGEQAHTITYEITNNSTGRSSTQTITLTVEPETAIVTNAPTNNFFCANEGSSILQVDNSSFSGNINSNTPPYILRIDLEARNEGSLGSLSGEDLENGGASCCPNPYEWEFDPAVLNVPDGRFDVLEVSREIVDLSGTKRTDAVNYFYVFGAPDVSLTNVGGSYCEDDGSFTINRSVNYVSSIDFTNAENPIVTSNEEIDQPITNGYLLYRFNGSAFVLLSDFTASGTLTNTFDPSDPNQDGSNNAFDLGTFRIDYETEALTPNNCSNITQVTISVRADTPTPELNAETEALGGSVGLVSA